MKAIELLKKEIEAQEKVVHEKREGLKNFTTGNMIVSEISSFSSWTFIKMHHKDNRDVYFEIEEDFVVKYISWSSRPFNNLTDNDIVKAQEYISQVADMLEVIKTKSYMDMVSDLIEYHNDQIKPETSKLNTLKAELRDIEAIEKQHEDDILLGQAIGFFENKKLIGLSMSWEYSRIKRVYNLEVLDVIGATVKVRFDQDSNSKKLTGDKLLSLYNHIMGCHRDYDYDDKDIRHFFKVMNLKKEDGTLDKIEITEKEYNKLR